VSDIGPDLLQAFGNASAFIRWLTPKEIWSPDDVPVWIKATTNGFVAFPFDGRMVGTSCTHICTALIRRSAKQTNGTITRSVQTFSGLAFLVLDDVMEKVEEPALKPSAIVETSPPCEEKPRGSYQYFYLLSEPVTDLERARILVHSLSAGGLTDPAGVSVVKVVRVPGSKPPGKHYTARLVAIEPDLVYDPNTILEQFGVAEAELQHKMSGNAVPAPEGMEVHDSVFGWLAANGHVRGAYARAAGFWDVTCPWADLHTDPADDLAGYKPATAGDLRRAFKCFHQHGEHHQTKEFLQWVCDNGGPREPMTLNTDAYVLDELAEVLGKSERGAALMEEVAAGTAENVEDDEEFDDHARYRKGLRELLDYAVLDVSGKVYLTHLEGCPLFGERSVKHLYSWAQRYEENDRGTVKAINPVAEWLGHEDRKVTLRPPALLPRDPVGFIPRERTKGGIVGVINAYRGRPLGAGNNPRDWDMFRALVRHVAPDNGDAEYLLDWIASKLQRPWLRQVAVVSVTPTFGTGRSTLFRFVGDMLGPGNASAMTAERLFGTKANQFNAHLEKLLITVSEVESDATGDIFATKGAFNRLKDLVDPDSPTTRIERKGAEGYDAAVFASFMIATNSPGSVPLVTNDRRFTVLNGNDDPLRSPATMHVVNWLKVLGDDPARYEDALDVIQAELQERDVSQFEPSVAFNTSAKDEAIEDAKSPVDRAIETMLHVLMDPGIVVVALLAKVMKTPRSPVYDEVEHLDQGRLAQQIGGWLKSHGRRVKWIAGVEGRMRVEGTLMTVRALNAQCATSEKHGRLEFERFVSNCSAITAGSSIKPNITLASVTDRG
jgi:uncharacterized protein DUF5906